MSHQQLIDDVLAGDHEKYTSAQIITTLKFLDDQYTNDGELTVECTDQQYDAIRLVAQRLDPSNVYFTGVGADVRGGKIDLPFSMPSLTQVDVGELAHHIKRFNLAPETGVVTDKHDGTSLLIIYNDVGELAIAYSRGNGLQGADVTRHVRKMKNVPQKINERLSVRCEVQFREQDFEFLQDKVMSRSGKPYKNSRNMVAGIMNAETNPDIVYEYIRVIAYTVKHGGSNMMNSSKSEQLARLETLGFEIPVWSYISFDTVTEDKLTEILNERRTSCEYLIDGLVVDVDSREITNKLDETVGSGNPNSAFKYKVADASNSFNATVDHVEWNVSKHGYLKPTVVLEPFDLLGVTITHATGFNAKFIQDNNIGPGAVVQITRSGDVIPYIQHVVQPTTADMPDADQPYIWTETKVDIVLEDAASNEEVAIQRLIDFCTSMDFPKLREGNIRKLYAEGFKTCHDIVNLSIADCLRILGVIGVDVYNGISEKLNGVMLYDLMGSTPFFGRGIGKRKMKKAVAQLGEDYTSWTVSSLAACEGFDEKTANAILSGIADFNGFLHANLDKISITEKQSSSGPLAGSKVCMTGFRDKEMARNIEDLGGEVQSGVSGKTTILVCTDVNSNSGKAKKARDITESGKGNIEIVSVDEFRERISEYRS